MNRQVSFRMQRKNILRKTFVTSDKWKGAARRVKIKTQVRTRLQVVTQNVLSFGKSFCLNKTLFNLKLKFFIKIIGPKINYNEHICWSAFKASLSFPFFFLLSVIHKAFPSKQVLMDDQITILLVIESSINNLWAGGCWLMMGKIPLPANSLCNFILFVHCFLCFFQN